MHHVSMTINFFIPRLLYGLRLNETININIAHVNKLYDLYTYIVNINISDMIHETSFD